MTASPVPTMHDWEDKIGISHLDQLHAARETIVGKLADLRAMHGPFGKFDPIRKQKVGAFAEIVRAEYAAKGQKITEKRIEYLAHAHPDYVAWLTQMLKEHAKMIDYDYELKGIEDRIVRETAIIGYARSEIGMT